MIISELGDYSVIIMKDSEDKPWYSLNDTYTKAANNNLSIGIYKYLQKEGGRYKSVNMGSDNYIYSGRRLILFFKERVDKHFKVGDKIGIFIF